MKKALSVFLALCVLVPMAGLANAAEYPTKQITVLQGFKPGGGSDILAQLSQPYLEKYLGKGFINQYVPGATGAIAWTRLTKATKADGYTIAITNTPMLQTNYIINKDIAYTIHDFTPLANVVTDPGILVVSKDSPIKTLQDFIDAAKKNPGKVTVGNSGTGGDDFFNTIRFSRAAGIEVQMIPFEGDGPSWQAALGNKIDVSCNNLGTVFAQVKAGNLRAIAIFSAERYSKLPDVPTARELGFDLVAGGSRGYGAPKGIPAEARAKLLDAFTKLSKETEFIKACEERGLPVDMKVGDAYAKYFADEEAIFSKIWNEVKDDVQK